MKSSWALSVVLGWLSVSPVVSLPTDSLVFHRRSGPTLPTEDPFYTPPSGFESTSPGTILRQRTPPYPIAAFGVSPVQIKASYQLLYTTTDSFGNATATVSTILVPHNADYTKLLSYQVAEDAADPNCAPSFAFQQAASSGGSGGEIMPEAELLLIESALQQGWVVTVPDHLGPKGTFLANILSGQATLDNIRAAIASSSFSGISSSPTITMWGYSGGSLATGFAAELQPTYAPELKIAGAALGGTVPQILPVLLAVNKGLFVGLVPAGIMGLANEYPAIEAVINAALLPSKRAEFEKTSTLCLASDIIEYFGQDIYSYVNDPNIFTDNPTVNQVLSENNMGNHIPQIPLIVYKSANDEISPVNDTDALVTQYCNSGVDVEYKKDFLSEHGTMAILGVPDAMLWLRDRMNGVAVTKGCSTSTVLTSLLSPESDVILGSVLITALLDFLQAPAGPIVIG
jgi:hypothetical protein